jgi:hypothetical protein
MPNYDYDKDILIARDTEKEISELLEKQDCTILKFNHDNRYDLLIERKGKKYTVEIKEDFTCKYTGNVGVEYECRGKPSGISVSKADFYVYKLHTYKGIQIYMLKTNILKKMIKDKVYYRIVNGGDRGSNSMNYLFDYGTFIKYGKRMA